MKRGGNLEPVARDMFEKQNEEYCHKSIPRYPGSPYPLEDEPPRCPSSPAKRTVFSFHASIFRR